MHYEFEQDKALLIPLYLLFLFIGLALLFFAITKFRKASLLIASGKSTEAVVAEILTEEDGDGKSYRPVFQFRDQNDKTVTFKYEVSSNPLVWRKGESVSIVYDPADPNHATVVSYWGLYRWSITLTMIALPLLCLSVGYFLFLTRVVD